MELLVVPLYMEDGREYGVAVLLFYGEIVADSIFLCDSSTSLDDPCLIEQGLCQGCLTRAVIAKEGNVLDFVSLIYLHSLI